jgi:hypothetical protein
MDPNFASVFTLRSRREPNANELINIRHVEQWQTDPPASDIMYNDTSAIPSRLYRESLNRSAPYEQMTSVDDKLTKQKIQVLADIQALQKEGQSDKLQDAYATYETILKAEKEAMVESLSANPYFDKYDVAGDSRNIARELRSVVHEDIVDRGVNESKKLLGRAFENRWLTRDDIQARGLNTLAYFRR